MQYTDLIIPGLIIVIGLLGRELWLHIQITAIKQDISWIKKSINKNNN